MSADEQGPYSPPQYPRAKPKPLPLYPSTPDTGSRQWLRERVEEVYMREVAATFDEGQDEYAGAADNAFGNFDTIAEDLGVDPEKVLWTYAMKHRMGIDSYLRGHKSQREDVRGRITDLIVYLFILWGMIDRESENA